MNSLIKKTSQLVILTLIAGLLVMPTYPVWAEDLVEAPTFETIPTVETVSVDLPVEPAPVEQTIVAEPTLTTTSAVIESPVVEAVAIAETLALVASDPAVDGELDFTTVSDSTMPSDNLAISDEFGTDNIVPVDNLAISAELGSETIGTPLLDNAEISLEMNFTTLSMVIENLSVSDEGSFTTQSALVDTTAISSEMSFNTQTTPADTRSVSHELSFNTLPVVIDNLAVSGEYSFTTEPGGHIDQSVVSNELSFNTLPTPVDNLAVSNEMSFITVAVPTDTLSVSAEQSFTTESGGTPPPVEPPHHHGGGSSSSGGKVLAEQTYRCGVFLKKFIKYGEANDRLEVIKLQVFLRVFEGFKNLKVTGIYDRPTYQAVKVFQKRYSRDVLGPWGISDSTGYVYITTRLAINNIYCGRDTRNNLHFRLYEEYNREYQHVISQWPTATSTDEGYYLVPTTTASSSPVVRTNFLLAGIGNLLDFITANFCWLINLLLLLLILFLLWLLWLTNREEEKDVSLDQSEELPVPLPPVAIPLEDILTAEDEVALGAIVSEEEEQLPAANNNPEQEAIDLDKTS